MPAVLSKAGELDEKAKAKFGVLFSAYLQWVTIYSCAQAETQAYTQMLGGSTGAAGALLATTMSLSGLVELMVGPSFGKLTDAYGRKIWYYVYPGYGLVMWSLMAAFPNNFAIMTTGRVLGWTFATLCGGTVLVSISLSDLFTGNDLAKGLADFWSYIGAAILSGQFLGDNVMMYTGHPRYAYVLRLFVAVIQLGWIKYMIPETLPVEKRRPFAGFENPLRCFRVLNLTGKQGSNPTAVTPAARSSLRKLVTIALLQVRIPTTIHTWWWG
jgi:MFS family permease